jgi:hypothetical protein
MKEITPTNRFLARCCLAALALLPRLAAQQAASTPTIKPGSEGAVVLSPFVVDAQKDTGYKATTTLAGSRLNTSLADVASAVSVVTKEMFTDTGATDASTILSYLANAETGGTQGNFAGSGFDSLSKRSDNDGDRTNPQGNQRIRGLGSATLTRNFFLTEIPFDSYNSSRAEINRGPNSILFGLGTPGGIINNSTNPAELRKDFGEVSARFGSHNSHRQSFDLNKVLIEGRLAMRLSGLNEDTKFQQEPAFKHDKRLYGALQAVLLKNERVSWLGPTIMRGNLESGSIDSNPPNVLPPNDFFRTWWSGVSTNFKQYTGTAPFDRLLPPNFVPKFTANTLIKRTVPDMNTVADIPNFINVALVHMNPSAGPSSGFSRQFPTAQGFQARIPDIDLATPGNQQFDVFFTRVPELETYAPGFVGPSLQDANVFDYRNHLFSGDMDRVGQNFKAWNVTLEQTFFKDKRAGIEVAFDKQKWSRLSRLVINSEVNAVFGNKDVAIDISEYLGNKDPNPNLGRAVVRIDTFGDYRTNSVDREAMQATAYYTLDLGKYSKTLGKWLGQHTVTGFLSSQDWTVDTRRMSNTWVNNSLIPTNALTGLKGSADRSVQAYVYVSNDLRGTSGPGDVRLQQINVPVPVDGDSYNVWYYDKVSRQPTLGRLTVSTFLNGGDASRRKIDSDAQIVQSSFLEDHVKTMFGWRKDEATDYENLTTAQLAALSGTPGDRTADGTLKDEYFIVQDQPSAVAKGRTFTSSTVVHLPYKWTSFLPGNPRLSFHAGKSENFNPAGLRRSVYGDVITPPSGTTKEYGFSLGIGSKFSARINWFETSLKNADAGIAAGNASNRISFWLQRSVTLPQNAGITFAQAKAFMLTDVGRDVIPQIQSYADLEAAIRSLMPPEIASQYNIQIVNEGNQLTVQQRAIPNQVATADLVAKGLEIDLVGQITPNWRVMLNVAKQETMQSNSAGDYKRLVDYMTSQWNKTGLINLRDSPSLNEVTTYFTRWNNLVLSPLASVLAKDGTVSQEQRKWRANLITNYTFRSEWLRGFGLGGGLRWQDKAAVGYSQLVQGSLVVPDLSKPYFAPSEWHGDVWVSYRRKLTKAVEWKVQLNLRNAFGANGDIPFKINPDGRVAVVRVPNEKVFILSNTLSF